MLLHIFQATPIRIWFLLAALIGLGVWQARPRSLTPLRAGVLPAVLLMLSALAVATGFDAGLVAPLAWALGLGLALTLAPRLLPAPQARWSQASGRLDVAGSWLPLALILAVFALKYAAGISLALHPELAHRASFALPFSLAYGFFGGVFASRALQLLAVSRRAHA